MSTFSAANQVRLALKMMLSMYSWYSSCSVVAVEDGFGVLVSVKTLNNNVRKLISPVINGISVKTELE
jgi:hypothetical protein